MHHDSVVGGRRCVGAALEAAGAADVVRYLDEVVDFALGGGLALVIFYPSVERWNWGRGGWKKKEDGRKGNGKKGAVGGDSRCSGIA